MPISMIVFATWHRSSAPLEKRSSNGRHNNNSEQIRFHVAGADSIPRGAHPLGKVGEGDVIAREVEEERLARHLLLWSRVVVIWCDLVRGRRGAACTAPVVVVLYTCHATVVVSYCCAPVLLLC